MAEHTQLGAWGEDLVLAMFHQAGIVAQRGGPADLVIEGGIALEVKTAKPSRYNGRQAGFQFCIEKAGHASLKAAAVVLVCVGDGATEFFIIPAREVGNRRKLGVGVDLAEYKGRWAAFRNKWELLAEVA
jgi:hypothetical protein